MSNCSLLKLFVFVLFLDDPQVLDEIKNRNSMLEKNLQSVYVTSKGDVCICRSKVTLYQYYNIFYFIVTRWICKIKR